MTLLFRLTRDGRVQHRERRSNSFSREPAPCNRFRIHPGTRSRWTEFHTHQISLVFCPKRLVLLISVQQIELFSAISYSGFNRESHGNETDTVLGVTRVESGLVKVKFLA